MSEHTTQKDHEMDALVLVAQALTPLDRAAADRVLTWAKKRYVELDQPMSHEQMEQLNKFLAAISTTATRLQMAKPVDLLTAIAKVTDKVEEIAAAEEAERA